jgi:putative transposase
LRRIGCPGRYGARGRKRLDASLKAFCERKLKEPFPYLILDARYERVREDGIIASQAVLIAIGVDWEGRRLLMPE